MTERYKPLDDREMNRLQEVLDRVPRRGHTAVHAILVKKIVTLNEIRSALRTRSLQWELRDWDTSIEPNLFRFKRGIDYGHVIFGLVIAFVTSVAVTGILLWVGGMLSGDAQEAMDGMILSGVSTIAAGIPWMIFFRPHFCVTKILKWQNDQANQLSTRL